MNKRIVFFLLVFVFFCMQYTLWFGKGGWVKTLGVKAKVTHQMQISKEMIGYAMLLSSEIRDLQNEPDAIEEKARRDLGMMNGNEVFVQMVN